MMKSVPELIKEATKVFNKFIRDRYGSKCISCGQFKIEIDCGHYMPSTYSALRFNEYNCNSECVTCNRMTDDHLVNYRTNLISKIGIDNVIWLESHSLSSNFKWDRSDLLDIIKKYKYP